jgi:hypothetical protein
VEGGSSQLPVPGVARPTPYLHDNRCLTVFIRPQIRCCMVEEALYVREVTQEIPDCMSPTVAMRKLSISRSTLDRLCAQGRLEKIRVSDGRVGIAIESIQRHLVALNAPAEAAAIIERRPSRRQRELRARAAARQVTHVRCAA